MASFFQTMADTIRMSPTFQIKLFKSQARSSRTSAIRTKLEVRLVNCKKCNQEKNWAQTTQMYRRAWRNLPQVDISYSNKINKTTVSNIFLSTTKTVMGPLTIKVKVEKNGWVNIKRNSLQSKFILNVLLILFLF